MKFIKIPAFAIVLLLLMQIVSKALLPLTAAILKIYMAFTQSQRTALIWS